MAGRHPAGMRSGEPYVPLGTSLRAVFDDGRDVAGAVEELVRHAPAHRAAALVRRALVDAQLLEDQVLTVEVEVVLRVGSGGADGLGHLARGMLRGNLEVREGVRHL